MTFKEWFVEQHGRRPHRRGWRELMQEADELRAKANRLSFMADLCRRYDERESSARWAWNAKESGL